MDGMAGHTANGFLYFRNVDSIIMEVGDIWSSE